MMSIENVTNKQKFSSTVRTFVARIVFEIWTFFFRVIETILTVTHYINKNYSTLEGKISFQSGLIHDVNGKCQNKQDFSFVHQDHHTRWSWENKWQKCDDN